MDAATLRIVLIVLGALFLIGMYLWERHRARADDDDDWDEPAPNVSRAKREPNLGAFEAGEEESDASAYRVSAAAEGSEAGDAWTATGFDAGPDDRGHEETASGEEPEYAESDTLIVQLYVVARDGTFSGEEIAAAAQRHYLVPGDMAIFHRRKVEGAARSAPFSMANAFNPGTFPFDDMVNFSTRGLVLFARLDGATSDLMVFDELVQTARELAEELGGDLLDNARSPLGPDQIKRLRAEVLDLLDGIAEPDGP